MAGVLVGAAIFTGVAWRTEQVNRRIEDLQGACDQQTNRLLVNAPTDDFEPDVIQEFPICDPIDLAATHFDGTDDPPGVQSELVRAVRQRTVWWEWRDVVTTIGVLIVGLAAFPWAWYFLLRRIRELSHAVTGR